MLLGRKSPVWIRFSALFTSFLLFFRVFQVKVGLQVMLAHKDFL